MFMTDIHLALMIGSIRKNRHTHKPAQALIRLFEEAGATVSVLDLRELDLPVFDDGIDHPGRIKLLETYAACDGMVVVTPEYNHAISSAVSNAIDFARSGEMAGKPIVPVGVSRGGFGGVRAIESMRVQAFGLKSFCPPPYFAISKVEEFDPDNLPDGFEEYAKKFVDETIYWFRVIKDGKQAQQ